MDVIDETAAYNAVEMDIEAADKIRRQGTNTTMRDLAVGYRQREQPAYNAGEMDGDFERAMILP